MDLEEAVLDYLREHNTSRIPHPTRLTMEVRALCAVLQPLKTKLDVLYTAFHNGVGE